MTVYPMKGQTKMCQCEDRPCCGHDAEERADDAYREERAYYERFDDIDIDFPDDEEDFEDEDEDED